MNNYLLVLAGKHKGMQIKLPTTQFLIGRDPRCHLRPASTDVSRHHCAIACRGPMVELCDLQSENGTFLNDEPIEGKVRVKNGDVLRVGSLRFEFKIAAETPAGDSHVLVGGAGSPPSDHAWLVRDPSDDENKALDPAQDTSILPSVASSDEGDESARSDEDDNVSAVAGEFFRDYMDKGRDRRQQRREK